MIHVLKKRKFYSYWNPSITFDEWKRNFIERKKSLRNE